MFIAPWTCPILMKKTQTPQYLHVNHQNTRKIRIKMDENTLFLRLTKYWKYIRGLLSRSRFTFFQFPEPILTPSTVKYLFKWKVTKSTIINCDIKWSILLHYCNFGWTIVILLVPNRESYQLHHFDISNNKKSN